MRRPDVRSVVLAMFAAACSDGAPVGPTARAASSLRIAGPASVVTGLTATYDAIATLTDGATVEHVNATWSVDDPGVAAINSRGVLTAERPGTAVVSAIYLGATGRTVVQVLAKPESAPAPASANIVVTYAPSPAVGSLSRCPEPDNRTPTWRYTMTVRETGGVGFTLKTWTWNLYNEAGTQVFGGPVHENEYIPPFSVEEEEICHSLLGQPSGSTLDIIEGVDDNGHQLKFTSQARLLPVSALSAGALRPSAAADAPGIRILSPDSRRRLVRR
jgi:hypothetical protein